MTARPRVVPVFLAFRGIAFVAILLALPSRGSAQLLSPGKLSRPHADLEGLRNCTACHELGTPGISAQRCLSCHKPLASRIRAGTGFHASKSSDCASCHREHFGKSFALVRLDTLRFDHDSVGYALTGAHAKLGCRDCHTPGLIQDVMVRALKGEHGALGRTFLGLSTDCRSCHEDDDPHGTEFAGQACADCHDTGSWRKAPGFDHATTTYPLTGRHATVDCRKCHAPNGSDPTARPVRFTSVAHQSCSTCHQDEHHGAMEGRCESCHSTRGWTRVDPERVSGRFDHGSTGFALKGRHAEADCTACHDPARRSPAGIRLTFPKGARGQPFPEPASSSCSSCHTDAHDGAFADGPEAGDCAGCHAQDAWTPAKFGIDRHNRESHFPLEGAHLTVACEACHRSSSGELVMKPKADACASCHADDDPHGGQFEDQGCESCHTVQSFKDVRFDHSSTAFPLDGAHRDLSCSTCHRPRRTRTGRTVVVYKPLGTRCSDCHGDEP